MNFPPYICTDKYMEFFPILFFPSVLSLTYIFTEVIYYLMDQSKVSFSFPLPVILYCVLFFSYSVFHGTQHNVQIAGLSSAFPIEHEFHPGKDMPVDACQGLQIFVEGIN